MPPHQHDNDIDFSDITGFELSEWEPLEPELSAAQIAALTANATGKRFLDLGAGNGRTALPLANAGATVHAVDSNPAAIAEINKASATNLTTQTASFLDPAQRDAIQGTYDAILILGNTLLEVAQVTHCVDLLNWAKSRLNSGGAIILDDFTASLWEEVEAGNWQGGTSEDGSLQLVWAEGDPTIALREGDAVDPDQLRPTPTDKPLHLYSRSELILLTMLTGLNPPRRQPDDFLLFLEPPTTG